MMNNTVPKEKFLLTYENSKLKKQFIFDLPAGSTNIGGTCKVSCPGCYAMKAQVRFPTTVVPARYDKLIASRQPDFTSKIVAELSKTKKKFNFVRVHSSGEFYSQGYIEKWLDIAKQLPSVKFYAFTKRLKDFDFTELLKLDNFVIIDSLKFGVLNYGPVDKVKQLSQATGALVCPATVKETADSTICGVTCSFCMSKTAQNNGVLFVQH